MKCPVCGKEFSFFNSAGGGIYCSPACAEAAMKELEELLQSVTESATKEIEELLERMINEENEKGSEEADND